MGKSRLTTIFLIVFVDLMGFGLILPLLPFYAQEYGASVTLIGLLVASYAAAQLIGAPVLGRLSDQYGRRPVLLLSIVGTALGFLLLGLAAPLGVAIANLLYGPNSGQEGAIIIGLMFLSRIVDGLTGGNISVAQAYIVDITDEKDRARGLGLIGAAFGLGFIIGPAIGGLLSGLSYAAPAYLAFVLASINALAVLLWLPESLTPEIRRQMANRPQAKFSMAALRRTLSRPHVGPLLQIRFFFGLAFSMFQSIFALYAAGAPLALTPQATGFVLTYVGVLAALVQGVLVGKLSLRYEDRRLMLFCSALMTASLLAWGFTPNLAILLLILAPLAFGGGVLTTVLSSSLSKSVGHEEVGGILGISASLESSTRVISPALGGMLLAQFGPLGPAVFSALVMGGVTSMVWRRLFVHPDPPAGQPDAADQLPMGIPPG